MTGTLVPVVDLEQPEEVAAQVVRQACLQSGFFSVCNHGVPEQVIADHFEAQRRFFSLPLESKMTVLVDKATNRGYTPMHNTTFRKDISKLPDSHEGYYFGREVAADSEEAKLPLHGPNQWLSEELVPGYRQAVEAYFEAVTALGMRLLRLLALSLGLPADYFQPEFTRPILSLRPLHYSARVSQPEDGVFGAGAHTDWGMLTLLLTTGPGLQICPDKEIGAWVDVPVLEGAFIVNLGDMLERWTNGLYRSTLHRVVNTTGLERYSIAFFMEPNFNTEVIPLPQCCSEANPPRYPPTTCGEHLLERFRATHTSFAAAAPSG